MIFLSLSANSAGNLTQNPGTVLPFLAGILAASLLLAVALLIRSAMGGRKKKGIASGPAKSDGAECTVLEIGKLHEQGARSGQQDCFGVSDESLLQSRGLLAVVADGMGGLTDSDRVSAVAVEAVLDGFAMYQGMATAQQELTMLVKQAVESVNGFLGPENFQKSGSTLLLGLVRKGYFYFLSMGDSRIYLYRRGNLMQLNREHIYQNKLALNAVNGEIPLQDVYTDSRRNALTSFVGMGKVEGLDIPAGPLRLMSGDSILLMTDGVYNALEEEEMLLCLDGNPQEAARRLHQAIQEKGYTNQDNYTAVIIGCRAEDGT